MIRIDILPGRNGKCPAGLVRSLRVAIGKLLPGMNWERLIIEPVSETVVLTSKPVRMGGVNLRIACSVSANKRPPLQVLSREQNKRSDNSLTGTGK